MLVAVVEVRIGSLFSSLVNISLHTWQRFRPESTLLQLSKKVHNSLFFLFEKLLGGGDNRPEVNQLKRARFWFFL